MKVSCNGCRTLRKGCSDNCVLRPSLEWINSPDCQSNATMFLAKFYGRTAFINLISAAPESLRTDVFKSLLHEACGRLVNPTYGSMGLLWSGEWARCEAAVEAVLNGSRIHGVAAFDWLATGAHVGRVENGIQAYDIRHVPRVRDIDEVGDRRRAKRPRKTMKPTPQMGLVELHENESMETVEQPLNRVAAETELNLELTLAFSS
ncbi:hypothetical protein TanjilG_16891 [Lupinus angustifolius]|uniref:LOB domain-containing protein 40-like n=1 Tax=Lupinus angustifolius TaxID=3871 RepID=UPI00090E3B8D|nr:PREDICTED: LOB domain-containing protein 40-like [Lupinus angustifolius]OIV90931.1 hypothetical protein TanjilG_16891 [Lupinus angustifolius]